MDNAIGFPDTKLLDGGCLGWKAPTTIEKVGPDHQMKNESTTRNFCVFTSLITSVTALQANEIILFLLYYGWEKVSKNLTSRIERNWNWSNGSTEVV